MEKDELTNREKFIQIVDGILKDTQAMKVKEGRIEFSNGYTLLCNLESIFFDHERMKS